MLMAALQGGVAIGKGLGPVHALATTFGDADLHHGMLVTMSAPAVVSFYGDRLASEFSAIGEAMGLAGTADAAAVASGIEELNDQLGLPATLRALGYDKTDLDDMSADAADSLFNLPAPIRPSKEEYRQIIVAVMG